MWAGWKSRSCLHSKAWLASWFAIDMPVQTAFVIEAVNGQKERKGRGKTVYHARGSRKTSLHLARMQGRGTDLKVKSFAVLIPLTWVWECLCVSWMKVKVPPAFKGKVGFLARRWHACPNGLCDRGGQRTEGKKRKGEDRLLCERFAENIPSSCVYARTRYGPESKVICCGLAESIPHWFT